jgi:hypothetical protein
MGDLQETWGRVGRGVAGIWDIGEKAPIEGGFWEKWGMWPSRRRRNGAMEERLIFRLERRMGGDGLSGVHRFGDIPYPRQGPGGGD